MKGSSGKTQVFIRDVDGFPSDSLPEGLFRLDRRLRCISVNAAMAEFAGLSGDALRGSFLDDWDFSVSTGGTPSQAGHGAG